MIKEKSKHLAAMSEQVYYETTHIIWEKLDRHFRRQEAPSPWKEAGFNRLEYISVMLDRLGSIRLVPGEVSKEAIKIARRCFLKQTVAERFAFLCHLTDQYEDIYHAAGIDDAAADLVWSWQIHLFEIFVSLQGRDMPKE